MITVKRLGFFSEFDGPTAVGDSMSLAVRSSSPEWQAAVVRYLRKGIVILDVMERLPDVLDGSPVEATGSLVTDGTWYWREDLAHYVEKYDLALDARFLAEVASRAYEHPALTREETTSVARAVIDDWQRTGAGTQ